MRQKGIMRGIALLTGAALLGMGCPVGSYGAEENRLPFRYQTINDIVQGGDLATGRPQHADDLVTVKETQAAKTAPAVSVSSRKQDDEEENWGYGPGASSAPLKVEVRDDSTSTGPQVKEVKLGETYHEEYDIYTESIDDQFFIYTNIGNNGITDQQVYLDIPQNVSFTAEKDGVPISYTANERLGATGTYIFRFTAVKDSSKPLAEQVIYETTFNFRIQPKSPKAAESQGTGEVEYYGSSHSTTPPTMTGSAGVGNGAVSDGMGSGAASAGTGSGAVSDRAGNGTAEESAGMFPPVSEDAAGEAGESSSADGEADGNALADGREAGDGALLDGETGDGSLQAGSSDSAAAGISAGGQQVSEVSYDETTGMYRTVLSDGTSFLSSVPNGMLSNAGVYLDFSGLGPKEQQVEILLDGELFVPEEEGMFSQVGNYTVRIPDGQGIHVFSFHLLGRALSDLDSYTVPVGMKVTAFTRDGEELLASIGGEGQRLDFTADGTYLLTMENAQGVSYEIELTVDHEPPKFSTEFDGEAIVLSYESQDIAAIEVIDGQETRSYESLSRITGPGRYVIRVYDYAGNVSEASAEIPAKVNMAGVVAVVLIIGLIAGAVIFIRRTKKDFNVK